MHQIDLDGPSLMDVTGPKALWEIGMRHLVAVYFIICFTAQSIYVAVGLCLSTWML